MKKYKLEYVEAENGLEALRAYQTAQVQFNVILMGELLTRIASDCKF
jgi:hypothetical protein